MEREIFGKALVDGIQEAATMMHALLQYMIGQALKQEGLSDAEKAHLAGSHLVSILGVLNDHLSRIGDANFAVVMKQVQTLMERERTGKTSQAGLARLSALLLPLAPTKPQAKN